MHVTTTLHKKDNSNNKHLEINSTRNYIANPIPEGALSFIYTTPMNISILLTNLNRCMFFSIFKFHDVMHQNILFYKKFPFMFKSSTKIVISGLRTLNITQVYLHEK